jgi:general secretion pathway protein F
MPVYDYSALDQRGKPLSGIIDAESPQAARQKLRSSNIYPIHVNEARTASETTATRISVKRIFSRIRPADITMATRQLATLLRAGFPLVSAIDTLLGQTRSAPLKKAFANVKDALTEGSSFAAALSNYPNIFNAFYINMVRAGESSGTLEIVLERLSDIGEKNLALKNRIVSALAYPILMTFIGAAVLLVLLVYIVPNIVTIFEDMQQALPLPTRMLISISSFLQSYGWALLVLLILGGIAMRRFARSKKGRFLVDKQILKIPGVNYFIKHLAVGRFCRTLGSLLENGVSMLTALEISKNIAGNSQIAQQIEEAGRQVSKGHSLAQGLGQAEDFIDLGVQMIAVGEQSGQLEQMLTRVADIFENEVESRIISLTSLLEPFMILVMGVAVAFIVLSICLPIIQMNQLIV